MLNARRYGLILLSPTWMAVISIQAATRSVERFTMVTDFGTMVSTTVSVNDGARSRQESGQTGGLGSFWGHPKPQIRIERADLDKIWELDITNNRYTERSISPTEEDRKRMEKDKAAMEKVSKEPAHDTNGDDVKITTDIKVTGPGSPEKVFGWTARVYEVTTTQTFQSTKKPEDKYQQIYYQRLSVSEDPLLKRKMDDEIAHLKAVSVLRAGSQQKADQMAAAFTQMVQNTKGVHQAGTGWMKDTMNAWSKIKGEPVRMISAVIIPGQKTPNGSTAVAPAPPPEESTVQAGDFSGGVGSAVGSIASRWMSHKAETKADEKISASQGDRHPVWLADVEKRVDGVVVSAMMNEVLEVRPLTPEGSEFEVPAGYKKVKRL